MHLNFHFLQFLCPALHHTFREMTLGECFSQNKDELVLGFYGANNKSQYIRALLSPANTCLSFPDDYKRSKKNSANLFQELIGDVVQEIKAISYERAFSIRFTSGNLLLFKLHGNRSNIILYSGKNLPRDLFRSELKDDQNLALDSLNKNFPLTWERFQELEGNAASFLPTLGKIPREWLKANGYIQADLNKRWALMQALLDMLESPLFSIFQENGQHKLSLLPTPQATFSTADPIEACNEYFKFAVIHQAFDQEKHQLSKLLEDQKKKTSAYLKKTEQKLTDLLQETPPSQLADVIMANLHQIPQGAKEVTLFDFYQHQDITVQLKKGLTPQKQAENLYRKSKNRKIEIQQLEKNIAEKALYLEQLNSLLEELDQIRHFKPLREFAKTHQLGNKKKEQQEQTPFKRFEFDGYEIWVGKSAKANDEMLRYFAWKEDLWLHAKDVSGSHVLIKNKSGQTIPKTTLERAAELAAYYSKNKNESLAPVMYTPCKYVRKVKGSAPGAVMVDKESVLMVQPKGPQ